MSKKLCPKCGQELWETAEACPICETVMPAPRRGFFRRDPFEITARDFMINILIFILAIITKMMKAKAWGFWRQGGRNNQNPKP